MEKSWGAVIEAGAGWITKTDHKVFTRNNYEPKEPLDRIREWHVSTKEDGRLFMTTTECDKFAVKIERICDELGYTKRDRAKNTKQLEQYFTIRD